MVPYQVALALVAAITVLAGGTAALMVTFGEQGRGTARRGVIDKLARIAVMGAGALFALLTHAGDDSGGPPS